MKRFILVLTLLAFCVVPSLADPVDLYRAGETARAFFQNDRNVALRMASLQQVPRAAAPLTKAAEERPPFYIFNRAGGGFVIVAADDACNPILAYSFTHPFGVGHDMPEGLKAWLDDLAMEVEWGRSASAAERQAGQRKWEAVFTQTKAGDGYLPEVHYETPTWGQDAPFNDLAPTIGGVKSAAGCVPLAMSMLARFFRYPAAGKGTIPDYTYTSESGTSITIPGHALGKAYEWDKMRMDYSKSYTADEAAAVAQLVYDCGVMTQAEYGDETASNIFLMSRKAIDFLGYDPGATGYYRNYYSDEEWLDMLKKELQEQPVLYSARRDAASGHAFLIDGYDSQGFLSVNWGWNGNSNGYYALSAFAPTDSPYRYPLQHAAIFGLKPDAGGTPVEYLYLFSGISSSGESFKGLENLDEIVPRRTFLMNFGGICNGSNTAFDGSVALALTDAEGNIKDFVCSPLEYPATQPRAWRGFLNVSCVMNAFPVEGDVIRGFYRRSTWAEDDWRPLLYDRTDGTVGEIPVYDNQTLAEATTFSYNKDTQLVTIETKDRVDWSLKSSSGTAVTDGVSYSGVRMSINTQSLKGSYTLTLRRGGEQCILTLKF